MTFSSATEILSVILSIEFDEIFVLEEGEKLKLMTIL